MESPDCELRTVKHALVLTRRLLRCEREYLAGRDDVARCQTAAQTDYDRAAVACRACVDPKALGQRLRAGIEGSRWLLRCMPGADAPQPPPHCGDTALAAVERLIDGLFACHRGSILHDRLLDDTPCEDRVAETYRAQLAGLRQDCGQCFETVLGPVVRWQVGQVFVDAFCGTFGPPVLEGSARPTSP